MTASHRDNAGSTGAEISDEADRRDVAVLDPEGPPGVAFIRGLGSRGVAVDAYGVNRGAPGRLSRYVRSRRRCPSPHDTDDFIEWLVEELTSERIAQVAPTSDYVAFAVAVARERVGHVGPRLPTVAQTWDCLHKGRFGAAMEAAGFPTVPFRLPTSIEAARRDAIELGYPVMLKPRSHNGIGFYRGAVVADESELDQEFRSLGSTAGHTAAVDLDPDLHWPMMQRFAATDTSDVISVSGCVMPDRTVVDVGHCRKLAQWPPGIGIGSLFESVPAQPFTDHALSAVAQVAPVGPFELEVLVDDEAGSAWPIDLNPRGFGQVALEVARGNDLPAAWYESATGVVLERTVPTQPLAEVWQSGVTYFPGRVARLIHGPERRVQLRDERAVWRRPRVGSVFDWRDPVPAAAMVAHLARHPRSLVRGFFGR